MTTGTQQPSARGWHRLDAALTALRPHRHGLSLLLDAGMVALCWNVTYLFRLGFERWIDARAPYDAWVMLGVVVLYAGVFVLAGVHRAMWRFSDFGEAKRLALACVAAGLTAAAAVLLLQLVQVPRAVLALHPVITLMGLISMRIGYRMLYEHMRSRINRRQARVRRALVLGAGQAATLLIAGIQHEGWSVVGLLDDDPQKQKARVGTVPVLGTLEQLRELAQACDATHLILAMPGATVSQRRRAIELIADTGLPALTIPSAQELLEGSQVSRVRDIQPDDLLGRDPVMLDEAGIGETLRDKTVLITGAGGSIGSELCRQVARYKPARLVLFEQSEFNLYTIEQDLVARFPNLPLVPLIGDVKELEPLRQLMRSFKPHVVFHAAAYKHVPLSEERNAWTALRNNVLGTWHAARAAAEQRAERFVLISTDKAVNPTSVMGASKRAAESVISGLAAEYPATRFMAVRFGNVLGSSGSVIPKFKEQIARGGPVTVTHPDMIRYFMTTSEAARLVLQAAAIGESGQVLVLDMGEQVRIVDLARDLIRLAGHAPDEIEIVYTGLRPGEKLFEELLADADATLPTQAPRVLVARIGTEADGTPALLNWLGSRTTATDAEVRRMLEATVPEYRSAPALAGEPAEPQEDEERRLARRRSGTSGRA
jgi:FlaA1/EpsC-like NDP-sugar epimerase